MKPAESCSAVRTCSRSLMCFVRMTILEKGDQRCPYLPPPGEDIKIIDFRDQILAAPKDIEDLAEVGRMADTCPYFGSRHAIPQAEVLEHISESDLSTDTGASWSRFPIICYCKNPREKP